MDNRDDHAASPWHGGEREAQARAGVTAERMEIIGRRNIRPFMPDQHRTFFEQIPFIVVGSVDRDGWPWASVLSGWPGFVTSPDPRTLRIAARPISGDPLVDTLRPGAAVGLLGIELPTRRRNRMNGHVVTPDSEGFSVAVDQSFGNCPQYIQRRDYAEFIPGRPTHAEEILELDGAARDLISRTDTFFVASYAHDGVDVSHRGGRPGFLGIDGDALVVPDYQGNGFFNTLGNLTANPRAGLLLVDFERGDLLQLTGTTEIIWDGDTVRSFAGAKRLWRVTAPRGRWLRGAFPLRLAAPEFSPNLAATGTWHDTRATR